MHFIHLLIHSRAETVTVIVILWSAINITEIEVPEVKEQAVVEKVQEEDLEALYAAASEELDERGPTRLYSEGSYRLNVVSKTAKVNTFPGIILSSILMIERLFCYLISFSFFTWQLFD